MIITGFDGSNVSSLIDGAELKVLAIVLKNITKAQAKTVVETFKFDGMDINEDAVASFCTSFNQISKRVTDLIRKNACESCGLEKPDDTPGNEETIQ